ncbi:MAG: adenylyl-sulfate kinase [Candidatus Methanomethyliaceae archaeon]
MKLTGSDQRAQTQIVPVLYGVNVASVISTDGYVRPEDFEKRYQHKGCVVWLTGLSASGKSSIAREVQRLLFDRGCQVFVLDGDNIRCGLNRDLAFSHKDRAENIRRVGEVAKLFRQAGFIVIVALISPYQKDRDKVRSMMDAGRFFEVYVYADLETCRKRDPKGLYLRALAGEIHDFTGISAPYEPPTKPDLVLDTRVLSIRESALKTIEMLFVHDIIPRSMRGGASTETPEGRR